VGFLAPRLVVAFDATGLGGAVVSRGPGRRVRALSRIGLPEGALVPSAVLEHFAGRDEVKGALRALLSALGAEGRRACLVLPGGLARIVLLDVPAGVSAADFGRFRLSQALPFPASEALVESLRVGARAHVTAAVSRRVVEAYETLARDAGLGVERVELAPLAAVAALRRRPPRASTVDVILGDVAVCFVAHRGGALVAFRSRLRDPGPGEPDRLREEADRTARLAGDGDAPSLRVVGSGATGLIRTLAFAGRPAQPGWRVPLPDALPEDAAELGWLGAAL
jgi:hypothetical protein